MGFGSSLFLRYYKSLIRTEAKVFSLLIKGAFFKFGKKSVIVPPARLDGIERVRIGDEVFIGPNSWFLTLPDGDNKSVSISIGSGTSAVGCCTISAVRNVTLEEDVLLARNIYISDHMHKYTDIQTPIMHQGIDNISSVLICKGAWLGQNVVICPGVRIGIGAVIGSNSFVNRNIPDHCVAAGSPAKVIKNLRPNSV